MSQKLSDEAGTGLEVTYAGFGSSLGRNPVGKGADTCQSTHEPYSLTRTRPYCQRTAAPDQGVFLRSCIG